MKVKFILILILFSFVAEAQLSRSYDFSLQLSGGYFINLDKQTQAFGDTANVNFFTEPSYNYGVTYNKFLNRNYQASLGFYYDNRKFTANYYCPTCDSILVKTDESYNVNYLNIPLDFHFILYEGVHSFYFHLGLSANFLLSGNRQVYNLSNELVNTDLGGSIKELNLGISLGLDYKMQISNDVEFILGLKMKQATKSIMENIEFHNKRYGVHSGLVFAF